MDRTSVFFSGYFIGFFVAAFVAVITFVVASNKHDKKESERKQFFEDIKKVAKEAAIEALKKDRQNNAN
jgi:uncharacterized ion transporter superfamily protein YfcC